MTKVSFLFGALLATVAIGPASAQSSDEWIEKANKAWQGYMCAALAYEMQDDDRFNSLLSVANEGAVSFIEAYRALKVSQFELMGAVPEAMWKSLGSGPPMVETLAIAGAARHEALGVTLRLPKKPNRLLAAFNGMQCQQQ